MGADLAQEVTENVGVVIVSAEMEKSLLSERKRKRSDTDVESFQVSSCVFLKFV